MGGQTAGSPCDGARTLPAGRPGLSVGLGLYSEPRGGQRSKKQSARSVFLAAKLLIGIEETEGNGTRESLGSPQLSRVPLPVLRTGFSALAWFRSAGPRR